jgi:hypothetical protein
MRGLFRTRRRSSSTVVAGGVLARRSKWSWIGTAVAVFAGGVLGGVAIPTPAGAVREDSGNVTTFRCGPNDTVLSGAYEVPRTGGIYEMTVTAAGAAGEAGEATISGAPTGDRGGYGSVVTTRVAVPSGTLFSFTIACANEQGVTGGERPAGDGSRNGGDGGHTTAVYAGVYPGGFNPTPFPEYNAQFVYRYHPPIIVAAGGGGGGGGGYATQGGRGGGGGLPAEDGADGGFGPAGGDGGRALGGGSMTGEAHTDFASGSGGGGGAGCIPGAGGGAGAAGTSGGGGGGGTSCTSSTRMALSGTTILTDAHASQDGFVSFRTDLIRIAVPLQPYFSPWPKTVSVSEGESARFFLEDQASATAASLQWQRSDDAGATFIDIPGATTSTYEFTPTVADSGAVFRILGFSDVGNTHADTSLRVTSSEGSPPVITRQPTDRILEGVDSYYVYAHAVGNPTPTVRWQYAQPGETAFTDVEGFGDNAGVDGEEAGARYGPEGAFYLGLNELDGGRYRAVFTSPNGTVTSEPATVTRPGPPAITQHPAHQSVREGTVASFTAAATASPAATVQWEESADGATWTPIDGATSTTYERLSAAADDGRRFRAVFANDRGLVATDHAVLTLASYAPEITTQPSDQSVLPPGTATFDVVATGHPSPSYQWQRAAPGAGDGAFVSIASATGPSYAFEPTTADSGARFRVVVTNDHGTVTSDAATLTVQVPPAITSPHFANLTVLKPVSLTIAATGTPAPVLSLDSVLPAGLTFADAGDGTATISGTPAAGTAGTHNFYVRATNVAGEDMQYFNLTIAKAEARLTLTSSASTSIVGQPITIGILLAPVDPSLPTPTGIVEIYSSSTGTVLGTVTVGSSGRASLVVSDLPVGAHAIGGDYQGNDGFAPVSSGLEGSVFGQFVTYGIRYLYDTDRVNKRGATVPLKVALVDFAGRNLSAANVSVSGFRFVTAKTGSFYQLDLVTKGLPAGRHVYAFYVTGDLVVHEAPFVLR